MGEPAEYPSAPKLSAAEWKALSERVNDRLVELFTGSDAFLGKAGQRFVATSLKPKSIKTKGKGQDVTGILVLADLAGQSSVLDTSLRYLSMEGRTRNDCC